jgi:hypothetical protein
MSYGNQVLEVMNYFDRVIRTMEGAHKFVVQLSRINNSVDCDNSAHHSGNNSGHY